jgi:hypothetical protein
MPWTPQELASARLELLSKPKTQIEAETAHAWGARALAAYALYRETGHLECLLDAQGYHHEAVEHASESAVLEPISQALDQAKRAALGSH